MKGILLCPPRCRKAHSTFKSRCARDSHRHRVWKPGAVLPSEQDLAREFGVSSGTMRKALDQLEQIT